MFKGWNYRIVRWPATTITTHPSAREVEIPEQYGIIEAFYGDSRGLWPWRRQEILAWSPVDDLSFDDMDDLVGSLELMADAASRPVINGEDLPGHPGASR